MYESSICVGKWTQAFVGCLMLCLWEMMFVLVKMDTLAIVGDLRNIRSPHK